jgi:DNA-binding Xre family transcriptional regulator
MAARKYTPPVDWLAPAGEWPEGPFRPDAPVYALTTAALVAALRRVMAERGLTMRSAAQPAGIDPTSLSRLVTGKVVPDLGTITALEHSLDIDLWPGRVSGPRPG